MLTYRDLLPFSSSSRPRLLSPSHSWPLPLHQLLDPAAPSCLLCISLKPAGSGWEWPGENAAWTLGSGDCCGTVWADGATNALITARAFLPPKHLAHEQN